MARRRKSNAGKAVSGGASLLAFGLAAPVAVPFIILAGAAGVAVIATILSPCILLFMLF